MTARQCYEAILIELNKENAPNILLEDFNYLFNKAINQYINKRYNIYDINQQTTDDLRVLKATALLQPHKCKEYGGTSEIGRMMGATYEVTMPPDYLHILNCICIYDVNKTFKCYNKGDVWRRAATRLTADVYSQILDNFWLRPTYRRPYYYIHNINQSRTIDHAYNPNSWDGGPSVDDHASYNVSGRNDNLTLTKNTLPTNPRTEATLLDTNHDEIPDKISSVGTGVDASNTSKEMPSNTAQTLDLGKDSHGQQIVTGVGLPDYLLSEYETTTEGVTTSEVIKSSLIEKGAGLRYGNVSTVRMEIRYGTDDRLFRLKKVYIDYIKAPQNIRLTQEQLDVTEDTSQMLEFPDYVCQEIINELVHIVMENITEQRLQTHPVVSQSIANPAQAQAPEAAGQPAKS